MALNSSYWVLYNLRKSNICFYDTVLLYKNMTFIKISVRCEKSRPFTNPSSRPAWRNGYRFWLLIKGFRVRIPAWVSVAALAHLGERQTEVFQTWNLEVLCSSHRSCNIFCKLCTEPVFELILVETMNRVVLDLNGLSLITFIFVKFNRNINCIFIHTHTLINYKLNIKSSST